MALPDYFKVEPGTSVVWGHNGGSGVTLDLSFNNLAAAAGQQGAVADLGTKWDEWHALLLLVESGTAPTANGLFEAYLAFAMASSGQWPQDIDGTNKAYTVAYKPQLGSPYAQVVAVNVGNVVQAAPMTLLRPPGRYVSPVVVNNWSQNVRNQGTPANNLSRLILGPAKYFIEE